MMQRSLPPLLLLILLAAGCSSVERGKVLKVEQRSVRLLSASGSMVFKEKADISSGTIVLGYREKLHRRCEQRKLFQLVDEGSPVGQEWTDWNEAEQRVTEYSRFLLSKLTINGRTVDTGHCEMGHDNLLTIDIYKYLDYTKPGQRMNFKLWYALRGTEKTFAFYVNKDYITAAFDVVKCRQMLEDNPLSGWWRFKLAAAYYAYDPGHKAYRSDAERRFAEHVGYEKKWYETMAKAYSSAKVYGKSARLFEEISRNEDAVPTSFHYAVQAAIAYQNNKEYKAAIKLYQPFWRKPLSKTNRALLANNLGAMYASDGDRARGFLYYRYAILFEPKDTVYKKNHANTLSYFKNRFNTKVDAAYASRLKSRKAKIDACDGRLRRYKSQAESYARDAQRYVSQANQATAEYNRLLYNKYASFSRANALSRRNRYVRLAQQAESNKNVAIRNYNREIGVRKSLVRDHNALVDHIQAIIKVYNAGIAEYNGGERAASGNDHGTALRRFANALGYFERVLKDNSSVGVAVRMKALCHFSRGVSQFNTSDTNGALKSFLACFAIDPTMESNLKNIAVCLTNLARSRSGSQALALVEEAVLFDPSNQTAQEMLRQLGG